MSIPASEARAIIRKAKRRVPEGESIAYLNLTAMMDMMTILLVFLIMNLSIQTSPLTVSVQLSSSSTHAPEPEQSLSLTIAPSAILVDGKPVVKVLNGDVDASEKQSGQFGLEISKLKTVLSEHHEREYQLTAAGEEPTHELTIIADKEIPYRLLYAVMYTAGRASAKNHQDGPGFQKYRLIVTRQEAMQ